MRAALDSMEDPILHLAVHLTLVGALREGEIVGLTPEDLDFDAADGIGTFRINKSIFMKSLKLPGMLSVKSKKGLDYMDMILKTCLLYTSPSPRDRQKSRMPSSA